MQPARPRPQPTGVNPTSLPTGGPQPRTGVVGRAGLTPRRGDLRGWVPLFVLPASVLVGTPPTVPRWELMWLLAGAVFAGCKWLTWRRTPASPATPWWQHAAYLLAWPGLDAGSFLRPRGTAGVRPPATREWLGAAARTGWGLWLLFGLAPLVPRDRELLLGWVGMVGLILTLHFGSFALLSCGWRAVGVAAQPLMDRPTRSGRVAEFWGRRWNTAFRTLTHRFLFRPLTARLGPRRGVVAGFLFSGLVHELVVSVPARGGYGGPTLYFLLQAAAVLAERAPAGRRLGLGDGGWRGRLFTVLAVALPAGCLFHPPFVRSVIVPFLAAIGAASRRV